MIVREGFMLTGLGLAVGLVGSLALTRLLHSLVFGVSTLDAFSFTAGVAVLATASLAATLLPARRAARLEPLVALHED
jgi:ABC-type antimicrobial peptide transport system permease subunit